MSRKITITLSGRAPVTIDPEAWPRIVSVDEFSGQHACQANTIAWVRVRQHEDGRAIVYASRDSGPGGWPIGANGWDGGVLLGAGEDIAAAIRSMGGGLSGGYCAIDADALIRRAIASLPAEELA